MAKEWATAAMSEYSSMHHNVIGCALRSKRRLYRLPGDLLAEKRERYVATATVCEDGAAVLTAGFAGALETIHMCRRAWCTREQCQRNQEQPAIDEYWDPNSFENVAGILRASA